MAFKEDKQRGKVGERVVRDYFLSIGADVVDTSEESEYQEQDVDLLVADGIRYEVKTDYMFRRTGNLAIEDSVYSYQKSRRFDSWLWTSSADRFAFVNPSQRGRFVVIGAEDLRRLVRTGCLRRVDKDDGYKSISLFLLPFEDYADCFEVIDY